MSKKIMTAVYLTKWQGKVGFNRLLHIKGEQNGLSFINIGIEPDSSEHRKIYNEILKEFKEHHILYAVMPDLCAGDGATQIAISNIDVSRFNALAIDHSRGRYGHIQMAEITEYDYTMTGIRGDGTLTKEADSLVKDAMQNIGQRVRTAGNPFADILHRIKRILHQENTMEVPALYRGAVLPVQRSGNQEETGTMSVVQEPLADKNIQQAAEMHDNRVLLGDGSLWLRRYPLTTRMINDQKYHLVPYGKGMAVVVPDLYYKEPQATEDLANLSMPCGFLIDKYKKYKIVNLATHEVSETGGTNIIEQENAKRERHNSRDAAVPSYRVNKGRTYHLHSSKRQKEKTRDRHAAEKVGVSEGRKEGQKR